MTIHASANKSTWAPCAVCALRFPHYRFLPPPSFSPASGVRPKPWSCRRELLELYL